MSVDSREDPVWQYLCEMVLCQENSGEMFLDSGAEGIPVDWTLEVSVGPQESCEGPELVPTDVCENHPKVFVLISVYLRKHISE